MAVDFRYDPPSGPLSGPDFIDQTERAFNELGGFIDEADGKAGAAQATADAALATANQALTTGGAAGETAGQALTAAGAAQTTADQALAKAGTAQGRADAAYDLAAEGKGRADDAHDLAAEGKGIAEAARDSADSAGETAGTALNLATVAGGVANKAMGVYTMMTDPVDANNIYGEPVKFYVVGDPDGGDAHFPADLAFPTYFDVSVNADRTSAFQTCWDSTAQRGFTRQAAINLSDPQNPVVDWTAWNSVAVPEVVKSVHVETDPAGQPAGTYLVITMETETGDEPVYIDMTTLVGQVYTAGNNGISLSGDYKISLKLSTNPGGLSIETDGLKHTLSYGAPAELVFGNTANNGTQTTVARSDHVHKIPAAPSIPSAGTSATTQAMGDSSSAGDDLTWSRSDHKHGLPGFGSTTAGLVFGSDGDPGEAPTLARSDHTHSLPAIEASFTRSRLKVATAIAAGTDVTIGSFKVGGKNLLLFHNNVLCEMGDGEQYEEVGTAGGASTTITILFDLAVGDLLTWVILN
jgi:hypothetical protein